MSPLRAPRPEVWLTVIDSPVLLQQSSCCPGRTASTVRLYFLVIWLTYIWTLYRVVLLALHPHVTPVI